NSLENQENKGDFIGDANPRISSKFKHFVLPLLVVITLVLIGTAVILFPNQPTPIQPLQFIKISSLTSEPGLEMYPEPHPDNRHFVYAKLRNNIYQLVVRDFEGSEWALDESQGKWDM